MRKPDPRKALKELHHATHAWREFNSEIDGHVALSMAAWKELNWIKEHLDKAIELLELNERATYGTTNR